MHGHLWSPQSFPSHLIKVLGKLSAPHAHSPPFKGPIQSKLPGRSHPASARTDLDVTCALQACRRMMHLLESAPHLHSTKEAPNSISQQACASGNWPDPRMAWLISVWQVWSLGKKKATLLLKKGQSDCELSLSLKLTGPLWLGVLFGREKARLFPWSPGEAGWQGQSGADFPSQRSKELVPAHAGENTNCSSSKYSWEILVFY